MRIRIPSPCRIRQRLVPALAVPGLAGALALPAAAAHATTRPEDRSTPPPNVTFPVALSANPVDARSYAGGHQLAPRSTPPAAPWSRPRPLAPCGSAPMCAGRARPGQGVHHQYRLTTFYAYLDRIDVTDDQIVQAGQPLGMVGDLGRGKRCQLGFQVRNDAGNTIYNPSGSSTSTSASSPR